MNVEVDGRKFKRVEVIVSDGCQGCGVLGTSFCDRMPSCSEVDGDDIRFYQFKEVPE